MDAGIQCFWDFLYPFAQSPYFLHTITFVMPHIACGFFLLLDMGIIPAQNLAFRKDFSPKVETVLQCMLDNFLANLAVFSIISIMTHLNLLDLSNLPKEAPTTLRFIYEFAILLIIWEFVVYPFHRFQHTTWWYQNFHIRHHAYTTFSYSTMSGNLIDEMISGTAIALPHIIFECHPITLFTYYAYFVSYGVAVHSGYNLPGCRFHYLHHVDTRCNYGGMFTVFDRLLGTYKTKTFSWEKELKEKKEKEAAHLIARDSQTVDRF